MTFPFGSIQIKYVRVDSWDWAHNDRVDLQIENTFYKYYRITWGPGS